MRLKPAVSVDEALAWLVRQATSVWGVEPSPDLERALRPTAEAMAAVSAADVPADVEPLLQ